MEALAEKLVISPIVPMSSRTGSSLLSLSGESAAERVAKALPTSRVAGAFHTVPAPRLAQLEQRSSPTTCWSRPIPGRSTKRQRRSSSSVGRLRPLYAGPLRVSRLVEGMTPALLNVSKLNKLRSPSIKLV